MHFVDILREAIAVRSSTCNNIYIHIKYQEHKPKVVISRHTNPSPVDRPPVIPTLPIPQSPLPTHLPLSPQAQQTSDIHRPHVQVITQPRRPPRVVARILKDREVRFRRPQLHGDRGFVFGHSPPVAAAGDVVDRVGGEAVCEMVALESPSYEVGFGSGGSIIQSFFQNSPRILNVSLPLLGFDANLVSFDGVARRADQQVGEERTDDVAVIGEHGLRYNSCGGWRGRRRNDVRG